MAAGEFSDVWTLAEAATRQPFDLRHFLTLVWENTSGFLLAACLVSLAAALLSWVYMVRAGPADGPPDRTRTAARTAAPSAAPSAARTATRSAGRPDGRSQSSLSSSRRLSPGAAAGESDGAADGSDDAMTAARRGPPPPPPPVPAEDSSDGEVPDLVEMAHHLPGRVKQAELKHIRQRLQSDMTEEQKQNERRVERDQMAAILELMQQNSDKFGRPSLEDMQAQLKLYM